MTEIELTVSATVRTPVLVRLVERAATSASLTPTLKGTLAKYPGCIHWHYKKGKESGTLEVTWWPAEKRLWFKVAASRRAAWIDEVIPRLKQSIASKL